MKTVPDKKLTQITSQFTGGTLELFLLGTALYLGTIFSLGIAYPWLMCALYHWEIDNTIIDGKRQYFDGKGGELFKKYIKWLLLTIVTLGIYKLWLTKNVMVWKISHTHFRGGKNAESRYECKINEKVLMLVRYYAIIIFTLTIGKGAANCYKTKWTLNHTYIDGARLDFNGKTLSYLGLYVSSVFFTLITLGVYSVFFPVRLKRWETARTTVKR